MKKFTEEEKELIRYQVEKGFMWSQEGYCFDDMINDCDLKPSERKWAHENISYRVIRTDKEDK